MVFSVLFWNIWLDNQVEGMAGTAALRNELKRIIGKYSPDIIGLNEVLQAMESDDPLIADFMKKQGYGHAYYAPSSPFDDNWMIGAMLCSRVPFSSVDDVVISEDAPAAKRGYPGHQLRAITASLAILPDGKPVQLIVAHPHYLRPHTIREHYVGTGNLEKMVRSGQWATNTILGGDFNEPGFMPKAFKRQVADIMEFRTGSPVRPTWRHNGYRFTPIRANLDQLYWSKQAGFELMKFEVIDSPVSDHRPIFATFRSKTTD